MKLVIVEHRVSTSSERRTLHFEMLNSIFQSDSHISRLCGSCCNCTQSSTDLTVDSHIKMTGGARRKFSIKTLKEPESRLIAS